MQKVSKTKIAASYAKAWLDAAEDKKAKGDVFKEINLLLNSLKETPLLWKAVSSPADKEKAAPKIMEDIAKKLKLSSVSRSALALIAENGRLALLKLILEEYIKLYYAANDIIEVTVKTAVPLTATQDEKLKKTLEAKLNSKIVVAYEVIPEVLGGLSISFNSFLFDDTIRAKLKKAERLLASRAA